jgi:2-polyprenyl-3-methyl-5-hydroxy-6-metoxy-1,4-benzoquinol methylase
MEKGSADPASGPFSHVLDFKRRLDSSGWWHSFELPDGRVIKGSSDLAGLKNRISQFPIPDDLHGKRVLDVGAWDGWFSFEMERRGAEVLAIDVRDNPNFRQIHEILSSRVDYGQMDVYDLHPD